jgi:hypothetical protein
VTDQEIRDRLAATFDHEPVPVDDRNGPTGLTACGHCFTNWPCPTVRKIERVMVPVVRSLLDEAGA